MANFTGPLGLNTRSHILLKGVASVMMKNELSTWNHDAATSVSIAVNSRCTFQIPSPQITAKLSAVKNMDTGYSENTFFASENKTNVTIRRGKIVRIASTHLKVSAAFPSSIRWV